MFMFNGLDKQKKKRTKGFWLVEQKEKLMAGFRVTEKSQKLYDSGFV